MDDTPTSSKDDTKADAPAPAAADRDLVLVHGRAPDGSLQVLRRRQGRVEAGEMRTLEHGKPIAGEVVRLTPRREAPFLFDSETLLDGPAARAERGHDGPAQVATDAYRESWQRIFGPPAAPPSALN